jgi:hypothetical protein
VGDIGSGFIDTHYCTHNTWKENAKKLERKMQADVKACFALAY